MSLQKPIEIFSRSRKSVLPWFVRPVPPPFISKIFGQNESGILFLKVTPVWSWFAYIIAVFAHDFEDAAPLMEVAISSGREIQGLRNGQGCLYRSTLQAAVDMGDIKSSPVKGVMFIGLCRRFSSDQELGENIGLSQAGLGKGWIGDTPIIRAAAGIEGIVLRLSVTNQIELHDLLM
jgi:hypothetical protein